MTTVEAIDKEIAELVTERVDIDAKLKALEALKETNTSALTALVLERETLTDATTQIPAGAWRLIVSKTERIDTKALVKKHPKMKNILIAIGAKLNARDADAVNLKAGQSAEGIRMATTEYPAILDIIEDVTKTTTTFKVMEAKN